MISPLQGRQVSQRSQIEGLRHRSTFWARFRIERHYPVLGRRSTSAQTRSSTRRAATIEVPSIATTSSVTRGLGKGVPTHHKSGSSDRCADDQRWAITTERRVVRRRRHSADPGTASEIAARVALRPGQRYLRPAYAPSSYAIHCIFGDDQDVCLPELDQERYSSHSSSTTPKDDSGRIALHAGLKIDILIGSLSIVGWEPVGCGVA